MIKSIPINLTLTIKWVGFDESNSFVFSKMVSRDFGAFVCSFFMLVNVSWPNIWYSMCCVVKVSLQKSFSILLTSCFVGAQDWKKVGLLLFCYCFPVHWFFCCWLHLFLCGRLQGGAKHMEEQKLTEPFLWLLQGITDIFLELQYGRRQKKRHNQKDTWKNEKNNLPARLYSIPEEVEKNKQNRE